MKELDSCAKEAGGGLTLTMSNIRTRNKMYLCKVAPVQLYTANEK